MPIQRVRADSFLPSPRVRGIDRDPYLLKVLPAKAAEAVAPNKTPNTSTASC